MAFSSRTTINGKTLRLIGDTEGSWVGLSSRTSNKETTITVSSDGDLKLTATGNLNATIRAGAEDDLFNFANAAGRYKIFTGAGADTVFDGSGNNLLDGGAGPDTFVFNHVRDSVRNERDTIRNFEDDTDVIRIKNTSVAKLADTQEGALITLADGDRILVENQLITDIQDDLLIA